MVYRPSRTLKRKRIEEKIIGFLLEGNTDALLEFERENPMTSTVLNELKETTSILSMAARSRNGVEMLRTLRLNFGFSREDVRGEDNKPLREAILSNRVDILRELHDGYRLERRDVTYDFMKIAIKYANLKTLEQLLSIFGIKIFSSRRKISLSLLLHLNSTSILWVVFFRCF